MDSHFFVTITNTSFKHRLQVHVEWYNIYYHCSFKIVYIYKVLSALEKKTDEMCYIQNTTS